VRRIGFDQRPFNAVASCEPERASEALAALSSIGAFRATPYRSVLIGWIGNDPAAAVADAWRRDPALFSSVVRISPLSCVVPFERDDVTEELCIALEPRASTVYGRSFYVRVRLRGLKGRVEAQAVERALGAFLVDAATRAGRPAKVTFDDPDVVVVVEVVGKRAGFGFVERGSRAVQLLRPR